MNDLNATTQLWIGRPAPRSAAKLRLICLPHAGGGSAAFRPWVEHLPSDIELCSVQLPGREKRMTETPYSNMDELVADLATPLEALLDGPFALFGHSMGGLMAFALARHLRATGRPRPAHLFVSARRAPQIADADAPIHQLPDPAFVAALVRRYNGIPREILQNVALLRLFLPTLRADLTMIETYRYVDEEPFDFPISVFGGWEDARATQADLCAWRDLTRSDFALRMFPGGHFFIQSERERLVAAVAGALASPAGRTSSRVLDQQLRTASPAFPANAQGSG